MGLRKPHYESGSLEEEKEHVRGPWLELGDVGKRSGFGTMEMDKRVKAPAAE